MFKPVAFGAGGSESDVRGMVPPIRTHAEVAEDVASGPLAPSRAQAGEAALYVGVGIPLALAFASIPFLCLMGWFLSSLFHEFGHTVFAWFTGHPSFPAISLAGHAAAVHGKPLLLVRLVVVAAVVALAVRLLSGAQRVAVIGVFLASYGLLVGTSLVEIGFLVSGHLGELIAASLCLWRAADGENCHSNAERAAYAMLGWYLIGDNLALSFGLAFRPEARAEYAASGSFGLTNDYLRLATEHVGLTLAQVGFLMGLVALAVPALTLGAFALRERR
ncbi:MAG: hypothetical protein AAGA20_02225 [Planctomycetota bacterium]